MFEDLRLEIKKLKLLILGLGCLLIGGSLFLVSVGQGAMDGRGQSVAIAEHRPAEEEIPAELESTSPEIEETEVEVHSLAAIARNLEARAVYVFDIADNRVLYEKNGSNLWPLASLTKLMTAWVALEEKSPTTAVTIRADWLPANNPNILAAGDRWRLQELIDIALVQSSNDAAEVVAQAVGRQLTGVDNLPELNLSQFVDLMNEEAERIGLEQTTFFNPSGLDLNQTEAGARGSAADVSLLLTHILKHQPELLGATARLELFPESLNGRQYQINNTNRQVGRIPRLLASKTGFTDKAGGNLAVVFEPRLGKPIVVTVLGSGFDGRFRDVLTLTEAINDHYERLEEVQGVSNRISGGGNSR